jgi:hypothetical protein
MSKNSISVHGLLFSLAWDGVGWGGAGGGVDPNHTTVKKPGILSFLLFHDPRLLNVQGSLVKNYSDLRLVL